MLLSPSSITFHEFEELTIDRLGSNSSEFQLHFDDLVPKAICQARKERRNNVCDP
jgi:hypothetical protein